MQGHKFFIRNFIVVTILWSYTLLGTVCKFCKRWQCHLRKKMQIDFLKTVKKLCSQIFQLFKKNEKFMVSMVSCDIFGNSLKDFSFLDIFKMSKNKNPQVYSKYLKNRTRTFNKSVILRPYMVTKIKICTNFCDWLF